MKIQDIVNWFIFVIVLGVIIVLATRFTVVAIQKLQTIKKDKEYSDEINKQLNASETQWELRKAYMTGFKDCREITLLSISGKKEESENYMKNVAHKREYFK